MAAGAGSARRSGGSRSAADEEARPVPNSRPGRLRECGRRLEEELAVECRAVERQDEVWAARVAAGRQPRARPPTPYLPPERPAGEINVSDPDSRRLKAPRGYLQGYNAQAAVTDEQIVVAAELNADAPDFGHLEPMVGAARDELERAGVSDRPGVVVADAGYWNREQMEAIVARGIQVIVRADAAKRRRPRPGWDGRLYPFMRRVLQTEQGGRLYRQRRFSIEVEDGPDLDAKGNLVDHEYEITREGDTIASVSKRWFRVRETYGVEIAEGEDEALVLVITVCIDAMSHPRD